MTRLNLEDLEGRALMSANVVAVPAPCDGAVVRVLDSGDGKSGPTASGCLTDFSFQWGQVIGSNRASIMGDGFGLEGSSRNPDR